MADLDALRAHLADTYDFRAQRIFALEEDVTLLRDGAGRGWVARSFGPERSPAAVEGDAEILRWLATRDFPAERVIDARPVSTCDGHTVLLTEWVPAVPRAERRATIKAAGGIARLGALLGRLHRLEVDAPAVRRPGGAWHHMSDGAPAEELRVAGEWLEQAEAAAPVRELAHFGTLAEALEAVGDLSGMPTALLHPDPVLANVVATAEPGIVLVDWAAAGRGPRIWSLAFLLWAEGAKDLRRVDLAVAGYRRHVQPDDEELAALGRILFARPLVFEIWRLHHHAQSAAAAAAAVSEARGLGTRIAERAVSAFRQ